MPSILVVDDDPGVRVAMATLLRDEGFETQVAADGGAALAMVAERPPDVLLTDLRMPGMDGLALCRALHELDPDLPVIVVTATCEMATAVQALRAGASDYLTKPVDFDAMLLGIARVTVRRIEKLERERLRQRTSELYLQAMASARRHEEILAIVSHDLRNPLTAIALRAQQLAELTVADPEVERIVEGIRRNTQRMSRLIEDLVEEARLRTGHLQVDRAPHRVGDLLTDAADLAPLARQRRIELDLGAPETDRAVSCDRARIGQALGNLIANAIKFSRDGTTITVRAEDRADRVWFSVRDQGPGIPPDALPKIFEPFWQPEGSRTTGLGLGLYIVKSIVDAHGGQLTVESTVGVGTTFAFDLPTA